MSQSNRFHMSENNSCFHCSKRIPSITTTIIMMLGIVFLVSENIILNPVTFAETNYLSEKKDTVLEKDLKVGKIQWLETSYPEMGTGVVRINDSDMNLNPEKIDFFEIKTWSEFDTKGINLVMTETGVDTGLFEGTVFFSITQESSGHRLQVTSGDTIRAQYNDNTLPRSYLNVDELEIIATSTIGNAHNPCLSQKCGYGVFLSIVDEFDNTLNNVYVNQQIQIKTSLANGENKDQPFVYFVQIKNSENVVIYLESISGVLSPGQSFSPALSWIPTEPGSFVATAFVWHSTENATPLRPVISTTIDITTNN